MKKPILTTCLALLCCACSFGQATRTMSKDSSGITEKLTVLKADNKTREGKYTAYDRSSGKIITTGFYKNNQKDSTWREYSKRERVVAEGKYLKGQRSGLWKFYDDEWHLTDSYDYSRHQIAYHKFTRADSTHTYKTLKGKDTLSVILDRPPIYLGGEILMFRTMYYNLSYPAKAQQKGLSGHVVIGFTVDEHGNLRDYRIVQADTNEMGQEALRVVKLIPNEWVPGVLNGHAVPVVIHLPVAFNASKD